MRASRRNFLTITYHDIFDYPLTEAEILRWEVGSGKLDREVGNEKVHKTQGYYHLHGRSAIVKLRKVREQESIKKLKLARKVAGKLSIISSIKFIGVTGSLAMNNARRESDIDFMIITTGGTLWATRLIVYLATKPGYRVRGVGGAEAKDAICFNMWLDEEHLAIPKATRNLYTAHEVFQVVPLLNRDRTFEKFLEANSWALEFWPKADPRFSNYDLRFKNIRKSYFINHTSLLFQLIEPIAYRLQLFYMRKRMTRETVEPGRAFFHPVDWGKIVMREFSKRLIK